MFDLSRIDNAAVGVLGDLALDIYWYADMKKSELSRETPHYPLPIIREVMSLGAGGNVAANIAALQPKKLMVCGICGDDWRGSILREKLMSIGADTSGLIAEPGRFTQAYCKPMRKGISNVIYEDPRLDFSAVSDPSAETEQRILAWLDAVDGKLDVLCVCDQFQHGIVTKAVLNRLCRMKMPVLVDSRYRIGEFSVKGVLKPNEDECRNALITLGLHKSDEPETMAKTLAKHTGADVMLTLGELGSLYVSADGTKCIDTPAVKVEGSLDICGAGDTSLSAFACCLATGAIPAEAAEMSAYASAVTIRKIGTTGTATREEILRLYDEKKKTEL